VFAVCAQGDAVTSNASSSSGPVARNEPSEDSQRKLTGEQRQQRQRTDMSGLDDTRIEGNIMAVKCDTDIPSVVIANRDGDVVIQLLRDAAESCPSMRVGDYLSAEGEKQNEQLFEADVISVKIKR
jgi:hypothetical protein